MQTDIATPFGIIRAVWTVRGLFACSFFVDERATDGSPSARPARIAATVIGDKEADLPTDSEGDRYAQIDQKQMRRQVELRDAFDEYFDSGVFVWDLESLDWSGISDFHARVLRECFRIPSGSVISYGGLAERAGRPSAARSVGSAMARNRWPLLIPCHRVIATSGSLGGYSGAGGIKTKQALLDRERQLLLESAQNRNANETISNRSAVGC